MEVVLVRFVGAGTAAALSGLSHCIPHACIGEGLALVTELSRERPPALMPLIDTVARDVCRGWRGARIPDPIAVQHLESLPAILQEHGPSADKWTRVLIDIAKTPRDRKHADNLARGLATDVVSAATTSGAMQRSGLLVQVSMVLLHRLLESLLLNTEDLRSLVPYAEHLFADAAHGDTDSDVGGLSEAIERLAPSICPRPLLTALVSAERAKGVADRTIAVGLENLAYACQELLGDLKDNISATGDDVLRGQFETFQALLLSGNLPVAAEMLASAEDAWAQRPYNVDSASGNVAAAAVRKIRARLNDLRGNWQEAACDYAIARRFCSSYDVKGRWLLMMRQAAALTRHGVMSDDVKSLFDAAQIHAEAGGLLQEHDAPIEWATANVNLGNLLLTLAEREGRPERYLAAGLHFKPAVDVFSREGATEDWALAQLGLAHALKGQGEFQGDPVILEDAAFAYKAALGMLHAGRSPDEWAAAKIGLGVSLVRIAEEADEPGLMDEAIAALKAALGTMRQADTKTVEAALGRAYVVLAAEKDDVNILNDAVEQLQRALEPNGLGLKGADAALLLRHLGSSLWALGEASGDSARLQSALTTLSSSRDAYKAAGDASAAESIAKEISNLELLLVRMRRSQRHAANSGGVKV